MQQQKRMMQGGEEPHTPSPLPLSGFASEIPSPRSSRGVTWYIEIASRPPEDPRTWRPSGKVYERRHMGADVGTCGNSCHALHVRDESAQAGRNACPFEISTASTARIDGTLTDAIGSVQCIALVSPKWPDLMWGP